jgi:hypothetical protein
MDKKKLIIISISGISIILIVILLLLLSKSKSNNTYKITTASYTYTEEITTLKEDDETITTTTVVITDTTTTVQNEQTPTTPTQANTTRKTSVKNNQTTTSTTTTTTTTTIKHIPKCPEGYTMQNNKCVSEVAKEKVCDSGWWPYSDDLCINMNGEGYEIGKDDTCGAGYGYMSIIGFGTPTVYRCYLVKNGTYTCPKGYTMGSESCISIVDPS